MTTPTIGREQSGGQLVTYEIRAGVAHITLNRPEKRNAINLEVAVALRKAIEWFSADESAGAAVLAGAGPSFCAGGDISMFPQLDSEGGHGFVADVGEPIHRTLERIRKPIIAAVHGYCLAGGLELALACHFVYATETASFGMEEINLGLIPGWGGTVRLARINQRIATEMLLTGRRLSCQEAVAGGIVNKAFANDVECLEAAHDAAEGIAAKSRLAVECAIDVVHVAQNDIESAFTTEKMATAVLFGSSSAQDSIARVLNRGIGR